MIDQGADFLLHNADAAGQGVFQAARERGVLAFGSNADQSAAAPDTILASAVLSLPAAFLEMAQETRDGTFRGRVVRENLANGAIGLVYNPRLESLVPADVKERVQRAEDQIRKGVLTTDP